MDQTSNNEVQQTTTTAPETTQAAPQKTEAAPATQDIGVKGAIDAAIAKVAGEEKKEVESPAYTPNWKFKAMGEEKEVDEWVRPLIKDAETEKKFKEIYEKAYGLDHFKGKLEKTQAEHQELKANYHSLYNDVSEAMTFKQQGNLGAFFQKVGLSDEDVAKYMLDKINRQNLPPEQQQVYNELERRRQQEYYQARQLEETETRYREMASQAREWEVDQWLAKPEVSQVVQRYDATNGPGSFKRFVAEMGVMHHSTYGEDPPVETVVSTVMKRLGDAYRSQPASPPPQVQNNQEKPLPVIPNVSGKNVSPTRKAVRSVDDLRKISQEANG